MRYFKVLVSIKTENDKGGFKNVKEEYLVDAQSVTEAEANVIKDFEKDGFSQDYAIIGVSQSKIAKVIQ